MKKYNCPACNTGFDKLNKGGLCPNQDCRAPLKFVDRESLTGEATREVIFRKPREMTYDESDVELFVTTYDRDGIKVEKSNRNNYLVSFYKVVHFNWIYCPNCESKMFQNNYLKGSFEHKCHKCKAVTTYSFIN